MKAILSKIISTFSSPFKLFLFLLAVLGVVALIDYLNLGLSRRTFVFYSIDDGEMAVEDRMLRHSKLKEEDIIRYTEETIQGPVSPNLSPLFPYETRLKTFMLRDKTIYADFTESAALRLPKNLVKGEGRDVLDNFRTLYDSLLRNFPYVSDIWFFIEGNAVSLDIEQVLTSPEGAALQALDTLKGDEETGNQR